MRQAEGQSTRLMMPQPHASLTTSLRASHQDADGPAHEAEERGVCEGHCARGRVPEELPRKHDVEQKQVCPYGGGEVRADELGGELGDAHVRGDDVLPRRGGGGDARAENVRHAAGTDTWGRCERARGPRRSTRAEAGRSESIDRETGVDRAAGRPGGPAGRPRTATPAYLAQSMLPAKTMPTYTSPRAAKKSLRRLTGRRGR